MVQWIERKPPKLEIEVQLLVGAPEYFFERTKNSRHGAAERGVGGNLSV